MIVLEQARVHLEQLGLTQAAEMLDSRLQQAAHKELSYVGVAPIWWTVNRYYAESS